MAAEQSTAIVLRAIEFSETSLIVTLLTRDLGRISAIAKGARRPKGPFEGALDLLSVCRIVAIRKSSDTLDILTEAKLHRRFRGGEKSLDRVYAGYHVAEMLRLLTEDHDPSPDVYDLTIRTLDQIDGSGNVASTLLHFDIQLLRMLGHAPGTDRCTDCGGPITQKTRVPFSLSAGGIVCDGCKPKQQRTISLRWKLIDAIRNIQHPKQLYADPIDEDVYGETRAVLNRYIETVVGRVPRMQAFQPLKTRST